MTKRKLANKRAYDEMMLLHKLVPNDDLNEFKIYIEVKENGKEEFVIEHYLVDETIKRISGDNYVDISKKVIEYLSELN